MSDNFTLFQEQFSQNYYVKVASNFDSQLFFGNIHSLFMTEELGAGSPIMRLRFLDSLGMMVNTSYISPDAVYTVYMGPDRYTAARGAFSLAVNEGRSLGQGFIENVAMDINFLNQNWLQTLATPISRSWNDVLYSEVVTQIANECGFSKITVEPTQSAVNIIQPGWTNYQMLKWISAHALNVNGEGGYQIMIRNDGTFAFQTFNTLIGQQATTNLTLAASDVVQGALYGFNLIQTYAPMIKEGASGSDYLYFDYDTKQFVSSAQTLGNTNQDQLSDWYFVAQSHDVTTRRFDGGRDTNTLTVVQNKIANLSNSIQEARTTILGDNSLHIGNVVNIILKPSKHTSQVFNEMYSGRWLVSHTTQTVDFRQKQVRTDLRLIRAGLNGIKLPNFVKTKNGKKLVKDVQTAFGTV